MERHVPIEREEDVVRAAQDVVRAAQDNDFAVAAGVDLPRKTRKHLTRCLPVQTQVDAGKTPALGERVAHERYICSGVTNRTEYSQYEHSEQDASADSTSPQVRFLFSSLYHRTMVLEDLQARARKIKVLLFDVDGVLTNGDITVIPKLDGTGVEVKGFHAHDGLGISLARLGGLRTGIITKRQSQTVAIRARDLKLEFVYQGQHFKTQAIMDVIRRTSFTLDEIAYVGDDIVDLSVMRVCGLAIATANARPQVKAAAHWVTPLPGGQGAGRDAIEFILTAQGSLERVIEQYLDESNPEAANADIGTGKM